MSTSGYGYSIESILNENQTEQLKSLKYKWENDIRDSNEIISNIEYNNYDIGKNQFEVTMMLESLNNAIDYYVELGVDIENAPPEYRFQEIRRNLDKNYRKLSLIYYKYNFDLFNREVQDTTEKLEYLSKDQEELNSTMLNMNNRIENLGATFLNIVLTISITSSMIALLTETKAKYALLIVLASSWLLLTCIIFVGSYFKRDDSIKSRITFPMIVYCILTLITFITFCSVSYSDISDYIKEAGNFEQRKVNSELKDTK